MVVGGLRHALAALPPEKRPGWASGPVWTGAENLCRRNCNIYLVTQTSWPNAATTILRNCNTTTEQAKPANVVPDLSNRWQNVLAQCRDHHTT